MSVLSRAVLLLLVLLIAVIAIVPRETERFETNEYKYIPTMAEAAYGSCVDLVADKGWINPKDTSEQNKRRLDILTDMAVSRAPQTQLASTVYPNVDACTLTKQTVGIYNNNAGRNFIDPNTCVMKGVTAAGDSVYHELDVVDSAVPVKPEGCMVDLEKQGRDGLMKLLDDAYQLKMYPDIKEKADYRRAMLDITEQHAQEIRAIKAQSAQDIEAAKLANQRVVTSCRDDYTQWDDTGGWHYNFLDRHAVKCKPNEVLTGFRLESRYNPAQTRYKYRCCKVDTSPIPNKLVTETTQRQSPVSDSILWNVLGLTGNQPMCDDGSIMNGFQMYSKYYTPITGGSGYNYTCNTTKPYGIKGKKVQLRCRDTATPDNDYAATFNFLDRHGVQCNDNEGIVGFKLNTTGDKINYGYKCCAPEIVDE